MRNAMMERQLLFAVVTLIATVAAQDCWWTGCQPNDWAVTGCAHYGRRAASSEKCWDHRGVAGRKYNCCANQATGNIHDNGATLSNNNQNGLPSYTQFVNAVTRNGFPAPTKDQYTIFITTAKSIGKISSLEEAAMSLAQFLHESDGLKAKREYACEFSNCPNDYTNHGCEVPGQYYYGRGPIQLSWCYNYRAASQAIFGNDKLLRDPDLVARDASVGWKTAMWFWAENVHNKPGVQNGKFGATTKAINGALECSAPGSSPAAKRFRIYGNVRRAFGLGGAGDPSGCA